MSDSNLLTGRLCIRRRLLESAPMLFTIAGRFRRWVQNGAFRRRVPVVLQLSAIECGAACLAMVLSFYGRKTRVVEVRDFCVVGRDGLSARAIAEAARHFGLRVKAYTIENPQDLQFILLPAIVHWDFNHFVVVERWTPKQVEIVDPSFGHQTVSAADFSAHFTGVTLTLEPGVQFRRESADASPVLRYIKSQFLTPGIPAVIGQVLLTSLFLQLLGLLIPVLTKVIVDDILPLQQSNLMTILGWGILILLAVQVTTVYLRSALLIYLQGRLDSQLMMGFFEHILQLPFAFFQKRPTGDLLMRLNSNTIIRQALTNQTISLLLDGAFVIGYLLILLTQLPSFGLIVLLIGLLQLAFLLASYHPIRKLMQRQLAEQAREQSYLVEALNGIDTLKVAGAETHVFDHWSNLFNRQLNTTLRQNHWSAVVDTLMSTIRTFSPLLLLWVGAGYVLAGSLSLGTMLAFNALAVAFLVPLSSLVSSARQMQTIAAHLDRVTDVLEARPEQMVRPSLQQPILSGHITLHQVNFRYDPHSPLILQEISVEILPGQKVAIVGKTGSGKSTLAKLLVGLYQPTDGEIRYDDTALTTLNLTFLRQQLGVVLQEAFLFNTSVRKNIALHNPSLSLEQVVKAAKLAAIHDEILRMPMGYETGVAEGGDALSGGQRQRLSLARALVHKPAILVLDEATSHLDVSTEQIVDRALDTLACTRIIIAHRLSTIRNADLILMLENGRIVERGSHEALMAQNGRYTDLIGSQLEKA